jgi:outer membrane protein assembly factor BamA
LTTARVFLVLALIVCGCFISLEAQNFSLKLQGQSNQEQRILDSLYEPSTYDDLVSIGATVESLKNQLYYLGYVQLKLLSLDKQQDKFTARFDLGPSYSTIAIFGKTELFEALGYALEQDTDTKQRFVVVEMPDLEQTLNKISQNLSRQSYPFARVQLKNIR